MRMTRRRLQQRRFAPIEKYRAGFHGLFIAFANQTGPSFSTMKGDVSAPSIVAHRNRPGSPSVRISGWLLR
jgi:hypothetical protein